ncbi:hypothetical protein U1Q18_051480 [Sarracenia purpurea var. burkii]
MDPKTCSDSWVRSAKYRQPGSWKAPGSDGLVDRGASHVVGDSLRAGNRIALICTRRCSRGVVGLTKSYLEDNWVRRIGHGSAEEGGGRMAKKTVKSGNTVHQGELDDETIRTGIFGYDMARGRKKKSQLPRDVAGMLGKTTCNMTYVDNMDVLNGYDFVDCVWCTFIVAEARLDSTRELPDSNTSIFSLVSKARSKLALNFARIKTKRRGIAKISGRMSWGKGLKKPFVVTELAHPFVFGRVYRT